MFDVILLIQLLKGTINGVVGGGGGGVSVGSGTTTGTTSRGGRVVRHHLQLLSPTLLHQLFEQRGHAGRFVCRRHR